MVQQVGEPLELYNSPANRFVAGFIGSPAMNFAEVTLSDSGGRATAEADGLRIVLPRSSPPAPVRRRAARRRSASGPRTCMSRPPPTRPTIASTATSRWLEQLGSEILLDTRVGPALFVASVDPMTRVKPHQTLRLALNPERLHLFDAESEQAI